MDSKRFTSDEMRTIGLCLHAAANGPFFPDEEFHTIFGLTRAEIVAIVTLWPDVDSPDVDLAVNNTTNNLLGYPHNLQEELSSWTTASRGDLARLLTKWRGDPPSNYLEALE